LAHSTTVPSELVLKASLSLEELHLFPKGSSTYGVRKRDRKLHFALSFKESARKMYFNS
jgi:hypothetical protein